MLSLLFTALLILAVGGFIYWLAGFFPAPFSAIARGLVVLVAIIWILWMLAGFFGATLPGNFPHHR